MARYGVTFASVANAASQLEAKGIQPTVDHVRHHLGVGSKTAIAKHLKRWHHQMERSAQTRHPLAQQQAEVETTSSSSTALSADDVPEQLLNLMKDFWQSFYRAQVSNSTSHCNTAPRSTGEETTTTPNATSPSAEQYQLICDYVVNLEAELAETTTQQHRLARRLEYLCNTDYVFSVDSENSSDTAIANRIDPQSSVHSDPTVFASPFLDALQYIRATLEHTAEDRDRLTQDLHPSDSNESELTLLKRLQTRLDVSAVRESALRAENASLREQIQ
ncbi:MAG: DNA-binding protein, partial [Gammaproteobacteria bacterium]